MSCWLAWDRPGPAAAGTDPTTAPWPRTYRSPRKAAVSPVRVSLRRQEARWAMPSLVDEKNHRCVADHRHVARQLAAMADAVVAAAAAAAAPNDRLESRRGRDARNRRRNRDLS